MKTITAGFIPLTDAAPLIVAHEKGFAAEAGIALGLVREVSWANIRDKLSVGLFDAAHMIAPLALASAAGIGHVKVPMIAPVTLALNGNAITASTAFAREIGAVTDDPAAALPLMRAAIARRREAGLNPPTFGVTFPFSTHNYILRAFLAAGGIDPDEDVQLVVIPPPLMVGSLERGLIDGFCVGSPWNSVAVDRGIGHIVAPGSALFRAIPEKVLAIGGALADGDPGAAQALTAAVVKGAAWCADPANAIALAELLADPRYLDVPAPLILRTIEGRLVLAPGGPSRDVPDFIRFDVPGAIRPDAARMTWLYVQMLRWRQARRDPGMAGRIDALLRPGMFGSIAPGAIETTSTDAVGSLIEPPLDWRAIDAYLAAFDARGLPAKLL
ncbi:MAG: ABC transporter substrate-binding protein [Phreatobacter sp.]|uniref:CmpA/NrtA family ABC transporter substrate-binding protein n=1 Tax=Phreatobacter sp. TaxID=1966341 RepID=UPI001A4476DA|nr:CmpA/NrtA family ABC transporter substrate-binding protein [Phreatobacter sp.]MBL8570896.1 ABC transporter substrate-binding protein [Phreatobacter sp.]